MSSSAYSLVERLPQHTPVHGNHGTARKYSEMGQSISRRVDGLQVILSASKRHRGCGSNAWEFIPAKTDAGTRPRPVQTSPPHITEELWYHLCASATIPPEQYVSWLGVIPMDIIGILIPARSSESLLSYIFPGKTHGPANAD